MLEARRLAYLKAMGIMQYSPIETIDGAKASILLTPDQIYPELDDIPVDEAPIESTPSDSVYSDSLPSDENCAVGGGIPEVAVQPTRNDLASPEVGAADQPSESPPSTPDIKITPLEEADSPAEAGVAETDVKDVERPVRFALTMVEIPGKLLVLADLSDASAMGCSAKEYQLLQGILKSLSIDGEPSQHLFRWPLVNNKRIAQGRVEAAEGLQGFLTAKLEKLHVPNLLLMGQYASGFMPEHESQSTLNFPGSPSGGGVLCFRVPSLEDMLGDWQNKPKAWSVLARLKPLLA